MRDTPDPIPISPGEILERILDPNEGKTPEEWVCADEITRLTAARAECERQYQERVQDIITLIARVAELEGLLDDAPKAIRIAANSSPYTKNRTPAFTRGLLDGYEAAAQVVEHLARAALPQPAPRTDSRYNNAERIFGDD